MKVLSLNAQKAYNSNLESFLKKILESSYYDFLLLQEATESVLKYFRHSSEYSILTATDEAVGEQSHLCIVYRTSIPLLSHQIQSFAGMRFDPVRGYKHPGFGVLSASFKYEGKEVCLASVHLHSGIDAKVRVHELVLLREFVSQTVDSLPAIVSGDFNFGYPWELSRGTSLLAPELLCVTRALGGTLDSRYSEYANHLPNKVATFFAKFGLGIKLRADHFFVSQELAESSGIACRILPDRVSDHSPIELILAR
ncbi:MAG: hypothetical protein JWN49_111 [Parcubacteria group bacterium]|nr:hypothetical protein [Parcubacteria group bacterium]